MLLLLRNKLAEGDRSWNVRVKNRIEQAAFTAWSYLIRNRMLYEMFLKGAYIGQQFLPAKHHMIRRLPFAGRGWTQGRDLRQVAAHGFIQRFHNEGHGLGKRNEVNPAD
jgi:L-lactate dehydrogenase complex protein LldF